jgi:ABC-type glycerol-3-phosphate transport system substrate-binding protein
MRVACALFTVALACFAAQAFARPVEVNFQYWGDLQEIPIVEQVVSNFNRLHSGIHVTAQRMPGGGSCTQKLLVQVTGHVAPDVVFVEMGGIPPLVEKGVMMSLNPLLAKTPGFRLSDWYLEVTARFTQNGQLYILPVILIFFAGQRYFIEGITLTGIKG